MDAQQIEERVRAIICEQLGMQRAKLNDTDSIVTDLGADSLDVVELTMAIEDDFDMEIPDDEAESLHTVRDVLDYVVKRKQ